MRYTFFYERLLLSKEKVVSLPCQNNSDLFNIMKTYLISTLKNVSSNVGQHIDFLSTIKSQEWTIFNEDKSFVEKFVFVDHNKLLVSVNGKSSYTKWEYIKQNSS